MMKKRICVLRFPLVWLFASLLAFHSVTGIAADKPSSKSSDSVKMLVGTWKLKEAKNPGSPSGLDTRLKLFTGTHWCVIQPDPDSGKIVFQHGGTYTFDGTELIETINFAGDMTFSLIGKTFAHKLRITGDVLEQMDPNGVFNETWQRAKAPQER